MALVGDSVYFKYKTKEENQAKKGKYTHQALFMIFHEIIRLNGTANKNLGKRQVYNF